MPPAATWNCYINCKSAYVGLLFLYFLSLLNPWLAHRRNVASLTVSYRYYFGRCSSEVVQLVPLRYCRGRSSRYFDKLHYFSVIIPRCYKEVYVNSFFSRTARLRNYLPTECFPLTDHLNGFKSRINRHLLTVGSF